jgi:hypothetical protein
MGFFLRHHKKFVYDIPGWCWDLIFGDCWPLYIAWHGYTGFELKIWLKFFGRNTLLKFHFILQCGAFKGVKLVGMDRSSPKFDEKSIDGIFKTLQPLSWSENCNSPLGITIFHQKSCSLTPRFCNACVSLASLEDPGPKIDRGSNGYIYQTLLPLFILMHCGWIVIEFRIHFEKCSLLDLNI